MTDKVYHSFSRKYRSRAAATAIQYAGGSEGWVVPSNQRLMEDPEGDLATGSLNAFAESHSSSSFDVTVDTGEALIGGAYLARDSTTTVTLASSTTGQTVYVGWGDSQTDTVIIGKSGAFTSNDEKIPIWTFDTDGSGVTSATDERVTSRVQAAVGGGATFVQPSQPDYVPGQTWLDTDNGVYHVAYDGDWHPVPPVTVTDEASTFTESDITISHTKTQVSNGSIELVPDGVFAIVDDFEDGDTTINTPPWSGWDGTLNTTTNTVLSGSVSATLSVSNNREFIDATRSSTTTDSLEFNVQLDNQTGNSSDNTSFGMLSTDSGPFLEFQGNGDIVYNGDGSILQSWTTGTTYTVRFNPDFSSGSIDFIINGTTYGPYSLSQSSWDTFRIRHSTLGSGGTVTMFFDDFQAERGALDGNAVVGWSSPSDMESWDLATFQNTLDSETVTIDVLDGSGNVLHSDIPQNFDISTVGTSKNVQLRANLSRDGSNNPTCDYLARRYTR